MILAALVLMMAAPSDGEPRFELRDPDSGEVLETLGLCIEAKVSATAQVDPETSEHVLNLALDERGQDWLARVTREHTGHRMAVIVDGEVLVEPVIYEPILGGQLRIAGGFTARQVRKSAIHLNDMCESESAP